MPSPLPFVDEDELTVSGGGDVVTVGFVAPCEFIALSQYSRDVASIRHRTDTATTKRRYRLQLIAFLRHSTPATAAATLLPCDCRAKLELQLRTQLWDRGAGEQKQNRPAHSAVMR